MIRKPNLGPQPGFVNKVLLSTAMPICLRIVSSCCWACLRAQTGKNLPAIQETWVQSLGQEDPLGRGMATHSSILAWRIPWTREAWQVAVRGVARSQI